MAQATPPPSVVGQKVAQLPSTSVDGRTPWPQLSVLPAARQLLARGQLSTITLEALATGATGGTPVAPVYVPPATPFVPLPATATAPVSGALPGGAAPNTVPLRVAGPNTAGPVLTPRVGASAPPPAQRPTMQASPPRRASAITSTPSVRRGSVPSGRAEFLAQRAITFGWLSFVVIFFVIPALDSASKAIGAAAGGAASPETITRAKTGRTLALVATALWIVGILLLVAR